MPKLIFVVALFWFLAYLVYCGLKRFVKLDNPQQLKIVRGIFIGLMTALLGALTLAVITTLF